MARGKLGGAKKVEEQEAALATSEIDWFFLFFLPLVDCMMRLFLADSGTGDRGTHKSRPSPTALSIPLPIRLKKPGFFSASAGLSDMIAE